MARHSDGRPRAWPVVAYICASTGEAGDPCIRKIGHHGKHQSAAGAQWHGPLNADPFLRLDYYRTGTRPLD